MTVETIRLAYQLGLDSDAALARPDRIDAARKLVQRSSIATDEEALDRALFIALRDRNLPANAFADARWKPDVPGGLHEAPAWLRLAAVLVPFLVLAAWFLAQPRTRHSYVASRFEAASPLDHSLVISAPEEVRKARLDKPYMARVARSLGVRQTKAALSIDPAKTVLATISGGGLFTPVRGEISATPAYLILIEAKTATDQEARRLEALHQRLVDAGVTTQRYYYFDTPALLHEDYGLAPKAIEEVAATHSDMRLIVLGEGRGFLKPLSSEPQPWTLALAVWPQRAMLTPKAIEDWGTTEYAIARELEMPLGRATIEGIMALAELLGLEKGRDRPLFRSYGFTGGFDLSPLPSVIRLRPYYWLTSKNPGEDEWKGLHEALRRYLDPQGITWLAALAVYPALQWDLTIYIGRHLKDSRGIELYAEPRLAALTQLPWLREGHMPDWLRQRFMREVLSEDERAAVAALIWSIARQETSGDLPHLVRLKAAKDRLIPFRGQNPHIDPMFLQMMGEEHVAGGGFFELPATLPWSRLPAAAVLAAIMAVAAWWLAPSPADGLVTSTAYLPLALLALLPALAWLLARISRRATVWWSELRIRFAAMQEWLLRLSARKRTPAQSSSRSTGGVGFDGTLTEKDWDEA
jgi:hypothetical protein